MNTIDQIGRSHRIDVSDFRIISLVPSITELLCDLGLEDSIVGCTKFCVHPKHLKKKVQLVGGTKSVKTDLVESLKPNIIIANREENTKEDIDNLDSICPVWVSNIATLDDSYAMILALGEIFRKTSNAELIVKNLKVDFSQSPKENESVAYLIWKDPYMSVGGDTFISEMLSKSGFVNVFQSENRYPEVTIEEIKYRQPDHIFLSSEPFPFKEKHLIYIQEQTGIHSIHLVDGEYFSWYGTRALRCKGYIEELKNQINSDAVKSEQIINNQLN